MQQEFLRFGSPQWEFQPAVAQQVAAPAVAVAAVPEVAVVAVAEVAVVAVVAVAVAVQPRVPRDLLSQSVAWACSGWCFHARGE